MWCGRGVGRWGLVTGVQSTFCLGIGWGGGGGGTEMWSGGGGRTCGAEWGTDALPRRFITRYIRRDTVNDPLHQP